MGMLIARRGWPARALTCSRVTTRWHRARSTRENPSGPGSARPRRRPATGRSSRSRR